MDDRMQAVELLKSVGLSEYESKAYLALLSAGEPMNGYEVAKGSGVPRSTVYEVLGKLVARGAAVQVHGVGRSTESFAAMPVEAFIDGYRSRMTSTLEGLAEALPRVAAKGRSQIVQKLAGRGAVMRRMNEVIARAQRYAWLSIWPDVGADLTASSAARVTAGVEVISVVYGHLDAFPGHSVLHEYLDPVTTESLLGCRLYLAVADHQEVVIAASAGEEWWGVWSDDLSVSMLAAEHVRYDVSMQVVCRHVDFGNKYESLFNDPTLTLLRKSHTTGLAKIASYLSES